MSFSEFCDLCRARGLPVKDGQVRHALHLGYLSPAMVGKVRNFRVKDLAGVRKYIFGQRGPQKGRPRGSTIENGAKPRGRRSAAAPDLTPAPTFALAGATTEKQDK